MPQFTYSDLRDVYETILSDNVVFYPIIGVKALGFVLVVISIYNKYLASLKKPADGKGMPLSPWDMGVAIFLILAVGAYDQVLSLLDGALGAIENQFIAINSDVANLSNLSKTTLDQPIDNKSWEDSVKAASVTFMDFMNDPLIIFLWIARGLGWLITSLSFGIYVAERFFFMGFLRVIGGLAMACLAIKPLQKWFYSWLGMYVSIYLVIIPYFLVEKFTTVIHTKYMVKFGAIDTNIGINGSSSTLGALLIIFLAMLQLKIYRRSGDIVMKIFS